jgi:hypothetical protein
VREPILFSILEEDWRLGNLELHERLTGWVVQRAASHSARVTDGRRRVLAVGGNLAAMILYGF